MGRRKQIQPRKAGTTTVENNDASKEEFSNPETSDGPFYIKVDRNNWVSEQHYDISEVLLTNLNVTAAFHDKKFEDKDLINDGRYNLRFQLNTVIKPLHFPILPASDIHLEFIENQESADMEPHVMVTGNFDGPSEGVSGLVHLVSMKLLTLRPITRLTFSESLSSLRLRVEIQNNAFEDCESLFETTRQVWKKSMMNVMAWLRPEVSTSEARYGYKVPDDMDIDLEVNDIRKGARFDVSGFYEAIKPSKNNPMLTDDMPDLLPDLRPYQRRAAFWMVEREKGAFRHLEESQHASPLCVPVDLVDSCSKIYYNSFSGSISMNPKNCSSYVVGGILADEMGLGKTIELLACIFAHRKSNSNADVIQNKTTQVAENQKPNIKRMKKERVECVCGAAV